MDIVCIYALQSKSVSAWLLELETSKNYYKIDHFAWQSVVILSQQFVDDANKQKIAKCQEIPRTSDSINNNIVTLNQTFKIRIFALTPNKYWEQIP